ncbi:hypothetical protein FE840_010280 [Peteryoungia desertarenae]|uniref:Homeo box C6a n=1 Tax=Peteryoungia desertarenae TaxID=1813451 RepID=A0ABX6QHM2_9HYPH|nr:hypothetical protein [Peteryoungia desertarenae]QLF68068.1 hypothetical protein FE840_010280 [Peteryoungia desertarenae]
MDMTLRRIPRSGLMSEGGIGMGFTAYQQYQTAGIYRWREHEMTHDAQT